MHVPANKCNITPFARNIVVRYTNRPARYVGRYFTIVWWSARSHDTCLLETMQLALRVYCRSSTGSRPFSTLRSVQRRRGRLCLGGLTVLGAAGAGVQYWRA